MRPIALSLLLLSLLALPLLARAADEEPKEGAAEGDAPAVSFNGTWKTISGGSKLSTLNLKQVDAQVTGSYSPGNGKVFNGVVTGSKLTFQWTQDGGYEGTAELTMDPDGKGFTGSSTALKPQEVTVTWNTFRSSFAGTWESLSHNAFSVTIVLQQQGDKVTGTYEPGNGTLEGTVSGRVLRFKWKSNGGAGTGRFVMAEGSQAFSGTYSYSDDPDDVDSTWNGKRQAVKPPEPPKPTEPEKPKTPPSFTGIWIMKFNDMSWLVVLQQAEGRVSGFVNNGEIGVIKDGVVDGNKVNFVVIRPGKDLGNGNRIPDVPIVVADVVLSEDGKSFTGKVNGQTPATGTIIEPMKAPAVDKPTAPAPAPATPPASFAGVWLAKIGNENWIFTLEQKDGRVTGFVNDTAVIGTIKDGVVDGKTLRFKVVSPGMKSETDQDPPEKLVAEGEVVMGQGGKSFTGKIKGTATTGTFVPPAKQ